MHLVFLNQYYPPDAAPTGVMLEGLVDELRRRGHEVTVICASGGYAGVDEVISDQLAVISEEVEAKPEGSLRILRVGATRFGRGSSFGKLADYLSYYVGVAWRLMIHQPRPDRIIALTTPPYLSVLARWMSRIRGADHAHWVMDLYPDVMVAHGMMDRHGWKHGVLAGLTRWGFGGARCAAVLTLGPDMAQRVGGYLNQPSIADSGLNADGASGDGSDDGPIGRVKWVPLWAGAEAPDRMDAAAALSLRRERGWQETDLIVMYSGNMGLGHRLGEILAAARILAGAADRDQDGRSRTSQNRTVSQPAGGRIRFVFFGGGRRRDEVLEFIHGSPGCQVEVHDYAAALVLTTHLQSADVHLASLDPEWDGTMVPSKLQGIFAAGRPVIFIGSSESSIGRWVLDSGGGWVVRPRDVDGLLEALGEAANPKVRMLRGRAARAYAELHFKRSTNIGKVADVLGG